MTQPEPALWIFLLTTLFGAGASAQLGHYLQENEENEKESINVSINKDSTIRNDVWYKNLRKPAFMPPDWVFGPIWFCLYCCMSFAAYVVWRDGNGFNGCASAALFLYGIQFMVNLAWTPLFFGMRRVFDALLLQMLLLFLVAACIMFMVPISSAAVSLMLPYLTWLIFATGLNFSIWKLNCSNPHLCH